MLLAPAPDAVLDLTRDLVRHNTTNPPGNETPAIAMLAERLRGWGFETVVVPYPVGDAPDNRTQVVARLRGTGERPGLLFSGHVDVVPIGEARWSVEPFAAEVRGDRLYGRGSCDMKGGVAALVEAAGALARAGRPLKGDLVVALTADEERNCLGADALVREPLFDGLGAAIVAEPTDLGIVIAEKGAFWLSIAFLGKMAHGSMPQLGANAAAAAAEFVYRWEQGYDTTSHRHELLGAPTLNIGAIHGGLKTNVVPDRCVVELDMRTTPGVDHADVRAQVEAMLAEVAAARPGISWEIAVLSNRAPVGSPADSDIVRVVGEAARAVAGVDPTPRGVPYCTEASVWVPVLGLEMVICGPGAPGMCHQPDEYVPIEQLGQAAAIYARAAEALLL